MVLIAWPVGEERRRIGERETRNAKRQRYPLYPVFERQIVLRTSGFLFSVPFERLSRTGCQAFKDVRAFKVKRLYGL